ncbi:hypothetical protein ACFWP7_03275 [Streptomyces sp. NPDC058470]|uniref:hypothetical protein n=1 Tax=Streptomyces sp. NPDC058470 TaxID=3346515 RepID=UPI0036619047
MTAVDPACREEHFGAERGFRGVDAHETRLLAEHARSRPRHRALDVGSGPDAYLAALAGPGYRRPAVDRTDASVAATRDRHMDR